MELHCLYPSYHHNVTFETEEPENTVDLQMKQMLLVKKGEMLLWAGEYLRPH
jgi:hypothetical protein